MRTLAIDIADVGATAHDGDAVVLRAPKLRASAERLGGLVSTAPRRIKLENGKAHVDVEAGPLEVQLRCRDIDDTTPFTVAIPNGEHPISLPELMDLGHTYVPPDVDSVVGQLNGLLGEHLDNVTVIIGDVQGIVDQAGYDAEQARKDAEAAVGGTAAAYAEIDAAEQRVAAAAKAALDKAANAIDQADSLLVGQGLLAEKADTALGTAEKAITDLADADARLTDAASAALTEATAARTLADKNVTDLAAAERRINAEAQSTLAMANAAHASAESSLTKLVSANEALATLGETVDGQLAEQKAIGERLEGLNTELGTANEQLQDAAADATNALLTIDNMVDIGSSILALIPGTTQPRWSQGLGDVPAEENPQNLPDAYVSRTGNTSAFKSPSPQWVKIDQSLTYRVSFWAKASEPGSRIYLELRDQDGNLAVRTTTVPGSLNAYLIGNLELPVEWTKFEGTATFREGVERVQVGQRYWRHSNGTNRTADQYLADLQVSPEIPTKEAVEAAQSRADEAHGVAERGVADAKTVATDLAAADARLTTAASTALARADAAHGIAEQGVSDAETANTNLASLTSTVDTQIAEQEVISERLGGLNTDLGAVNKKVTDAATDYEELVGEVSTVATNLSTTDARLTAAAKAAKDQADKGVADAATAKARADKGVADALALAGDLTTAKGELSAEAQAALDKALAAQAQADAGVAAAAAAKARADLGVKNAATAQAKANSATTAASTAQAQADKGVADAAAAKVRADKGVADALALAGDLSTAKGELSAEAQAALDKALAAQAQADAGVAAAAAAKARADLGVKNAATAQAKANSATTAAATAQAQADKGVADAKEALARANTAHGVAEEGVAAAKTANDGLASLGGTVDGLIDDQGEITGQIADLNTGLGTAADTAEDALADAQNALLTIDNTVDIGGSLLALIPGTTRPRWSEHMDPVPAGENPDNLPDAYVARNGGYYPGVAGQFVRADPHTEYRVSFWAKASEPGSQMVFDMRDQDGVLPFDGMEVVGDAASPGDSQRPFWVRDLKTEWTYYEAIKPLKPTSEYVKIGRRYWRHASGENRTADQYLANFRIDPVVPTQASVDLAQNMAISANTEALKFQQWVNDNQVDWNATQESINDNFRKWQDQQKELNTIEREVDAAHQEAIAANTAATTANATATAANNWRLDKHEIFDDAVTKALQAQAWVDANQTKFNNIQLEWNSATEGWQAKQEQINKNAKDFQSQQIELAAIEGKVDEAQNDAIAANSAAIRLAFPHLNALPVDGDGRPTWSTGLAISTVSPTDEMVSDMGEGDVYLVETAHSDPGKITHTEGAMYRFAVWNTHYDGTSPGFSLRVYDQDGQHAAARYRQADENTWSTANYMSIYPTSVKNEWSRQEIVLEMNPGVKEFNIQFGTNSGNKFRVFGARMSAYFPLQEQVDASQTTAIEALGAGQAAQETLNANQDDWNDGVEAALDAQKKVNAGQAKWTDGATKAIAMQKDWNTTQTKLNETYDEMFTSQGKVNVLDNMVDIAQQDSIHALSQIMGLQFSPQNVVPMVPGGLNIGTDEAPEYVAMPVWMASGKLTERTPGMFPGGNTWAVEETVTRTPGAVSNNWVEVDSSLEYKYEFYFKGDEAGSGLVIYIHDQDGGFGPGEYSRPDEGVPGNGGTSGHLWWSSDMPGSDGPEVNGFYKITGKIKFKEGTKGVYVGRIYYNYASASVTTRQLVTGLRITPNMPSQHDVNTALKDADKALRDSDKALQDLATEGIRIDKAQDEVLAAQGDATKALGKLVTQGGLIDKAQNDAIAANTQAVRLAFPHLNLIPTDANGKPDWARNWSVAGLAKTEEMIEADLGDAYWGSTSPLPGDMSFSHVDGIPYRISFWQSRHAGTNAGFTVRIYDENGNYAVSRARKIDEDTWTENPEMISANGPSALDEWVKHDFVVEIKPGVEGIKVGFAINSGTSWRIYGVVMSAFYPLQHEVDKAQDRAIGQMVSLESYHNDIKEVEKTASSAQNAAMEAIMAAHESTQMETPRVLYSVPTVNKDDKTGKYMDVWWTSNKRAEINAKGTWVGEAIVETYFSDNTVRAVEMKVPNSNGHRMLPTESFGAAISMIKVSYFVAPLVQGRNLRVQENFTPLTEETWHSLPNLRMDWGKMKAAYAEGLSLKFTVTWSATNSSGDYGIQIWSTRTNMALTEDVRYNWGPIWPWESGVRTQTITLDAGFALTKNDPWEFRVRTADTDPGQRHISSATLDVIWLEPA